MATIIVVASTQTIDGAKTLGGYQRKHQRKRNGNRTLISKYELKFQKYEKSKIEKRGTFTVLSDLRRLIRTILYHLFQSRVISESFNLEYVKTDGCHRAYSLSTPLVHHSDDSYALQSDRSLVHQNPLLTYHYGYNAMPRCVCTTYVGDDVKLRTLLQTYPSCLAPHSSETTLNIE